jgi:hypothetical protein
LGTLLKLFGRSVGLKATTPIIYDNQLNCLTDLTKFSAYAKSALINRVVLHNFLQGLCDPASDLNNL